MAGDCWFSNGLTTVHLSGDQITQYPLPWAADATANPDSPTALVAVTCANTTDCWAYGYYIPRTYSGTNSAPVLAHWTSTAWESEVDNLNLPGGQINGLACPTPTECALYGVIDYGRDGGKRVPFFAVHR